jgi:nickel superoxide dismutase
MNRIVPEIFSKLLPSNIAYAHCDIPCGIYDPYPAQIAAHSVIRMTMLLSEMHLENENPSFEERKKIIHQISRLTKVKEDHAELLKHEVRVIWGDYFKPEMLKENKNIHELVFSIMKLASIVRQEINPDAANQLLAKVQEFAEIFWKTKKRETIRIASSYPTGGELVVPK